MDVNCASLPKMVVEVYSGVIWLVHNSIEQENNWNRGCHRNVHLRGTINASFSYTLLSEKAPYIPQHLSNRQVNSPTSFSLTRQTPYERCWPGDTSFGLKQWRILPSHVWWYKCSWCICVGYNDLKLWLIIYILQTIPLGFRNWGGVVHSEERVRRNHRKPPQTPS